MVALLLGAGLLGLPTSTAIPVATVVGVFGAVAASLSLKGTESRL